MEHRTVRLDAAKRVLIVGATPNDVGWLSNPADRGPEPWIVLAGALVEPYVPGQAVLLAPGPMAGSVSPRGVTRVKAADHGEALVLEIDRKDPDERGAVRYVVVEDRDGIAAFLERESLVWPMMLAAAATIKKAVKQAYGWASPWATAWLPDGDAAFGNLSRSAAGVARHRGRR
ncbi:MAG TPA: hypothetical protein VL426_01995 [Candidatus Binatia bacterium]|jgi:hypothetical protein|nr:hypothetical protein [Candidatus Binatia bacterium]